MFDQTMRKHLLEEVNHKKKRNRKFRMSDSLKTTAEVSRKYYVLTNLSTRTHRCKYVYSLKCLRVLTETNTMYSLTLI